MSSIADAVKAKNAKRGNSNVARLTASFDQRQEQNKSMRTHRQTSMNSCFQDGVDHINIWESGKTDLGKRLALEATTDIDVQGLGRFRSIFALWVFLVSPPEARIPALRTGNPQFLRNFLRQSLTGEELYFPNLKYICASYLAQYILVNDEVREALIESSDVTITNYIQGRGGERIRHPQSSWWVVLVNRIRADLQAGRPVNVESWRDNDDVIDLSKLEVAKEAKVTLGVIKTPRVATTTPSTKASAKETAPKADADKPKELTKRQERDRQLAKHPYRDKFEPNDAHSTLLVFSPDAQKRAELMTLFLKATPETLPALLESAANGELEQSGGAESLGVAMFPTRITYDAKANAVISVATADFQNPYVDEGSDPTKLTQDELELAAKANLPSSDVAEAFRRFEEKAEQRKNKKKSSIPKTIFVGAPLSIQQALTGEFEPQSFVMSEEVQQWIETINAKRAERELGPVTIDNIMRSKSAREVAEELKGRTFAGYEDVAVNGAVRKEAVWEPAEQPAPVSLDPIPETPVFVPVEPVDNATNE